MGLDQAKLTMACRDVLPPSKNYFEPSCVWQNLCNCQRVWMIITLASFPLLCVLPLLYFLSLQVAQWTQQVWFYYKGKIIKLTSNVGPIIPS